MAERNVGRIVEIKGVVIDAVFPDQLPAIYAALHITTEHGYVVAEVQQHLGDDRVRAVAMDSTDGLARGAEVIDTGASITVPVGQQTLGRIFNVLGDAIDKGEPVTGERWGIHREPPAFQDLDPKPAVLETGIKVVDLLAPYTKGGKKIGRAHV